MGNALSHKLEVGERRSLASHYTLTTAVGLFNNTNQPVVFMEAGEGKNVFV